MVVIKVLYYNFIGSLSRWMIAQIYIQKRIDNFWYFKMLKNKYISLLFYY